jgi:thymidylate kinase
MSNHIRAIPRTICLAGADGTGKSTQAELLRAYLVASGHTVRLCTIWDLMEPTGVNAIPFDSKADIDRFLGGLHPAGRAMFLHMAMREALDRALEDRGDALVLVVGYWPKYNATERLYGAPAELLDALGASFPRLGLGLALELAPEIAFQRKGEISRYESGGRGAKGFLAFQQSVRPQLARCMESACEMWQRIDASVDIESVANVIQAHVDRWLANGAGT